MANRKRKKNKKSPGRDRRDDETEVRYEPYADEGDKLSARVFAVAQPLLENMETEDDEVYRWNIMVACAGWIMALKEPADEAQFIDRILDENRALLTKEMLQRAKKDIRRCAFRKRMLFPNDRRLILDWDVEMREHGPYLRVVGIKL
ncbi:MAG: hypothetical protein ACOC8E_07075 [Planctomycetota bacterium]